MPARPLLPPEGWARVSLAVLFDLDLPPVVRDTYVTLRVLAWNSDETPELSWEQITRYTGKERPTVYRHMLTLVNKGVIHWRTASVGTIVLTFTDGLSQKREMPITSFSVPPKKSNSESLGDPPRGKGARLKIETNGPSTTAEIQAEYVKLLGYQPKDWAAGESKAAKQIAACYTVSQFRECYEYLKSQDFWKSKRVRLRYLVGEIDEFLAAKAAGRLSNGRKASESANNGPWRRGGT